MNRDELKIALDKEWIPHFEYSLFGENDTGDVSCIMEQMRDRKWLVYMQDRGQKFSLKYFDTEAEACQYIYMILTTLYRGLSETKMNEIREFFKKHYM